MIYKRGNIWWMCYTDKNGRSYRESTKCTDKALAFKCYCKRKTEIIEDRFFDKKKEQRIKFEDFADEYYEKYSLVHNKKSCEKSDKVIIKVLKAYFSGYYLSEITKDVIAQFKAKRITEVCGSTVNRNLACLKSMFNRAIEWGKFSDPNPVKNEKMFKEPDGRKSHLQPSQLLHLIECCEDRLKPYVIVAVATGLRLNEMLSLKWGDINYTDEMICASETKNGHMREIPINKAIKNALLCIEKQSDSDYVFCNKDKKPNVHVRGAFQRALKKADITNFRWHDLRHTAGSLLGKLSDINTVKEILGHTTLKMTQRYVHSSTEDKRNAIAALDEVLDGTKKVNKEPVVEDDSNKTSKEFSTILSQLTVTLSDNNLNSIVIDSE